MIARLLKFFFLSLALSLGLFSGADAQEKDQNPDPELYDWYIDSFDSKINVKSDLNVEISETISVNFLVPKHGIFRTIPYRYEDNYGQGRSIFLEIDSVTSDERENYKYSTNYSSGGLTLKIGDPNTLISGKQVYNIKYHLSNILNYFGNEAEFYYNVNGNDWDVPTKKIKAEVALPENNQPKTKKYYLGFYGSFDSEKVKEAESLPLQINAENLQPKEGLTLILRWDERLTPKPGFWLKAGWFVRANGIYLLPFFILILLLFLLIKYGKDPFGQGTIAPQFEPPKELTIVEIGTIADERVDNCDLTATIISFAVNGFLKIKELEGKGILGKKDYELIKLREFSAQGDDKYVFDQLFTDKKTVKLSEIGKEGKLAKVRNEIEDRTYKTMVKRKFFSRNPKTIKGFYLVIGVLTIFSIFIFPALLERFFTITASAVSLFATAVLFLAFARYMPQRTKEGALLKEQIEGFKLYLTKAEKFRMKFYEESGIFEKYLPHAIALNVADVWAKKFEGKYKNPPDWYEGDRLTFSLVYFSNSLTSDFSTSVNSAFAASSASSGHLGFSSGGGFGGGGFGGGGGGSW